MEPTILNTPRIYNGAGIYNTGSNGGGGGDLDLTKFVISTGTNLNDLQNFLSAGDLIWSCSQQSTGWFWTPEIDLNASNIIDEEWNFTIEQFESYENGSVGMGEWYNNDTSRKCEFSIYIYSNKITISYGAIITETFNINYSLGTKVKVKKYIDQLTANIKVYYNDSLVVDFSTSRNNIILGKYRFHVGGLRMIPTPPNYGLLGSMDFKKCYIKIDNNLVWGVDS